ncbi:MAG: aminoacyl-tRNA hydrolase [Bacteroidetes bacterium]|nr:MAG: aminoacyl-tRNA hydrolase [Bacteroidota bacterium]
MTIIDLSPEIIFQTTRSGGKGGQNVNKVETAVIGYLDINASQILTEEQKLAIIEKLSNRINNEGMLFAKSQTYRTQLENKDEVIRKINELVIKALEKKKKRKPTKISKAEKEKRLDIKKKKGDIKEGRRRIDPHNM